MMAKKYGRVIEFYGESCPHCMSMKPIIQEIETETGASIQKLEVWNNKENSHKMEAHKEIIAEACGGFAGVPAFVNVDTKQALCGSHDKDDIIRLLEGEDCSDNVCKPHTKNK
ncbi:thioredoxin [Candidatus Saccharibacteria bacterium]|nr:thioredoxin [Candidatus Saccharibacteria bacterium]